MFKKLLVLALTAALMSVTIAGNAAPKPKPYAPKGAQYGACSYDPTVKGFAVGLQGFLIGKNRCVGAMKIVDASLPTTKPKTKISNFAGIDASPCKIVRSSAQQNNAWKGFPAPGQESLFKTKRHPSPTTVMQIVPIYSSDAPKGTKSPAEDYKFYFDFITKYFNYINDGPGNFVLKIPDHYYYFSGSIGDYGVSHGKDGPRGDAFISAAVAAIDSDVDFNTVNYTLVVVPAGTPSGIIGQQGFGRAASNEGYITNVSVAQPATLTGPNNTVSPEMATPTMWLHEFYHPGLNLGDNHAGDSQGYDSERGMGDWGLMSRNNGDLLAWQKWLLGFTQDSQVHCVSATDAVSTTHWLAPSSVKTPHEKLLVIKVSESKALIVESIRAKGLSYRFEKERLGALVYEVDASDTRHDYGYTVMYPDNRRPKPSRPAMFDASLKLGESLTYEGVKITNVEWGDFGDVIKVEPIK